MTQRSYTDADKAQVRALAVQGYSDTGIERETGIPARTANHWREAWPELPAERMVAIEEATTANVITAQRIKGKQLVHMETKVDDEPLTVGEATWVNMSGGTDADKLHKGKELAIKQGVGDAFLETMSRFAQALDAARAERMSTYAVPQIEAPSDVH